MNRRYKFLLLTLLFMALSMIANAQDLMISGRIIDEKKSPVEMVQVTLKHKRGNRIISYTLSDTKGEFTLKKTLNSISRDSLNLEFNHIGFSPVIKSLPMDEKPLIIEMVTKNIAIREVVVNIQKISQKRDTISYRIASFSAQEDRTLGDVLKRLPGIEVGESGEIKYQGRKLDKFYIEGSDMLGGRYGLATNNISHKDVASVEVMENHQAVRALEDVVFSDATAMNIKLKEDAKSRWAGTIKGGVGLPALWNAELFAMRFKAKTQTMNTYKGNNNGVESFDMTLFTPPVDFVPNSNTGSPNYINVSPSTARGIGSSRSNFNTTHNLSSNNLFKLGNDYDLIAEITATLDRRESEFSSQTTYILPDSKVTIEDKNESANSFKKALTGKVQLKANKSSFYLNNILDFSYDQDQTNVDILGTYPNAQQAGVRSYTVRNNLDILKRKGNKFFTFRSNNEYSAKPQTLTVTKDGETTARQNIDFSTFYSNNSLDYSVSLGRLRLSAPVTLIYQYRQIGNSLNDTLNNLSTNKLKLSTALSLDFDWNAVQMSLSANFFYQSMLLRKSWHQIFGVDPRLKVDWSLSSLLKIKTSASLTKSMPNENYYYQGNIMNDYRTMTSGYIDFATGRSLNVSANIEYKDVLKSLFANIGASWSKVMDPKTMGQNFEGDYIVNYYTPATYNSNTLMVYGSVSKYIKALRGTIALSPMYVKSDSEVLRNGISLPYTSDMYTVRLSANSQIGSKVSLNYRISASHTDYKMGTDNPYLASTSMSQSLRVSYAIIKPLQLSYTIDHYCNELDTKGTFKNFCFSDVSLSYLIGSRWELTGSVRNIFDVQTYSYFVENNLATFSSNYRIRPRNIMLTGTYRF